MIRKFLLTLLCSAVIFGLEAQTISRTAARKKATQFLESKGHSASLKDAGNLKDAGEVAPYYIFNVKNIVAKRNEFLRENVPGMFDNTYMTTSEYITPGVRYLKYHGMEFVETRGLWEVFNDYMGGPFVSHSFYSQDGKEIIVLEAWVYAAKYDKRQYLRQTESILYSFSWDKVAEK